MPLSREECFAALWHLDFAKVRTVGCGMHFQAENVDVLLDVDQGEAWVTFRWKDPLYGTECLEINGDDGHCSRAMPWYSGTGVEVVRFERTAIFLRFPPNVAESLRLATDVQISFALNDAEFEQLKLFVDYLNGEV